MAYKCSFLDNQTYGASDVSAAFSRLMSSGAAVYPQNKTVAQALNDLTTQVVSDGVAPYGGAEVTYSLGTVKIGQGDIYFKSGVCMSIDSDGVEIECENAAQLYVAAVYEQDFNRAVPYVGAEEPEGDAVLLAYIDAGGNVIDKRTWARAKVGLNSGNRYHDFEVFINKSKSVDNDASYTVVKTLPGGDFKYLLIRSIVESNITATNPYPDIIDVSQDGYYEFEPVRNSGLYWRIRIKRNGDSLGFYSYYVGGNGRNNITIECTAV